MSATPDKEPPMATNQEPQFIYPLWTRTESLEQKLGPDRCPQHNDVAVAQGARACRAGFTYEVHQGDVVEYRDSCAHRAQHWVDLADDFYGISPAALTVSEVPA